jgi:hypothetical protein
MLGRDRIIKEPSYKRPFSPRDFRGYFTWSKVLTESLSANLYHACHRKELEGILKKGALQLRSKWSIRLPEHGLCEVPGVWTGLNYFTGGNRYGPFLIEFPLHVLNGRRFMAFRREDSDRNRYFFVQYEAQIPIFSFKGEVWRRVRARAYFHKYKQGRYCRKPGAIYDIVLTQMVPFRHARSVKAVSHPSCIPGKCSGLCLRHAREQLIDIAVDEFASRLEENGILRQMIRKFPDLEGETVEVTME